jgi:hypothetical protein
MSVTQRHSRQKGAEIKQPGHIVWMLSDTTECNSLLWQSTGHILYIAQSAA